MTDPDLLIRRLRDAANPSNPERDLLQEASDALDDLQACKLDAERALGATADSALEAVSLLATEHLNLQRLLAETSTAQGKLGREVAMWRKRCERYEAWMALPPDQRHPHGPEFDAPLSSLLDGPDPAPVALPRRDPADRRELLRTEITTPEQRARSGAGVEAVTARRAIALARDLDAVKAILEGRTADQIEAAKPLVSIVLPALRFEDKRITSSNTLSVLCGDREVWTGNGTCELDIRTTVVENQISYAHPLTFDSMVEAKGTIWLQANDEAAVLLRTYRNGSIGLVLCFPAAKSLFTALLFDIADGEKPPTSEPGWIGFTLALETT